jgi:PadR family transcriptional regulator PadR
MKSEKAKAQLRKGILELCILSILENREAYASDIIARLKQADLIVVEGTLYPLLTRLKNNGLLEYHWQESKSGPPRKYYKLTEEGKATQQALKTDWFVLTDQVNRIIKEKEDIS